MGLSSSSFQVLSGLSDCQPWASGDSLLKLLGIVWSLRLSISRLRGLSGSGCRVLSVFCFLLGSGLRGISGSSRGLVSDLPVCQFRASGTLAPAGMYLPTFFSVCQFSGLTGIPGSRCQVV